ncbi:MAG: Crp/Fnr family transcriptional regulator [Gammaproteobacteria bacterium]|nr:Crp/Fnr family transcriptional regulator [Gammaproteobacteria bacterium]MBU1481626.1 Crp/Fnr family transcriptional regulator [Gammaproteobacteria bacterium]
MELRKLLQSLAPIPEKEWKELEKRLEWHQFAPGAAIFRPNDVDARIHYVKTGLVRYFYLTEDGRERNHAFAPEGSLVTCLPLFVGAGPCSFTAEALEATATISIPYSVFQKSPNDHECWTLLKLRLLEYSIMRREQRVMEFLMDSAETRYRKFLAQYGKISHRLPQYHIASYLGITPVALSRIRKRINPG